ncbi:uncharacterized protein MAM_06107 [Metarhizium album ARSEF 1941]|uniref:Uncharacterized protein n=1 Tax=Metarhizium album (strain ARSEF 1941) TaxID=1081103 RepID=A0A0B2WR79_METAS|nr:uncharacterized protein MAM_06107 [Metarhizium album ARSEF 1941]KHN96002.1 hypothetical protein MAM_06107 [Metarhizium album ARSEF 1941]
MTAAKPSAFDEPSSPLAGLCGFRNMDLALRILNVVICIAVLVVGAVATSRSGVLLIGILGPPAAATILWSLLQFGLSLSKWEYLNFRSRFRMAVGIIITLGWVIAVVCLALFRDWWGDGRIFSYTTSPESDSSRGRLVARLTAAGLGLGCAAA